MGEGERNASFQTTLWSLVRRAGRATSIESRDALEKLCAAYWVPLYAYLRRRGHAAEEARDLLQGFYVHLLERQDFQRADEARGRFRSFLLTALSNHVSDERRKERAQKRGGNVLQLSLEWERAEERYAAVPSQEISPERLFLRRWATTLLERAFERLRREQVKEQDQQAFESLYPFLQGEGARSQKEVARELGLQVGAVKTRIHRLRTRFRTLIRDEVAQTLLPGESLEQEIGMLFQALG